MKIAERILKIVEINGGNMSKIAEALNVTPSYISKLKRNPDAVPSERFLKDLCRVYNVNIDWLKTGEGEMLRAPSREEEIAALVVDLAKSEDEISIRMASLLPKLSKEQIEALYNLAVLLEKKDLP